MSSLLLTLAIAFVITAIAVGLLAVGWVLTGRSRLQAGACGRDPHKKRNEEEGCGTKSHCSLCDQEKKKS